MPLIVHERPRWICLLGGPNGAGKSTLAPLLLPRYLGIGEFVNADVIAQGLSAFQSEEVAMEAGRIMLRRLKELAAAGESFAFETTLASRSFAPWLRRLKMKGYGVHLTFVWLPSPGLAVARVGIRRRQGGHVVDEATVRRRYDAGLANFTRLYRPLADVWQVIDNSGFNQHRLVSSGTRWSSGAADPVVAAQFEADCRARAEKS